MTRHLLTLRQTSEARSWFTERYGRRLVASRQIPHHKIGGKVFVDLADVDEYAERCRVDSVQPSGLIERPHLRRREETPAEQTGVSFISRPRPRSRRGVPSG